MGGLQSAGQTATASQNVRYINHLFVCEQLLVKHGIAYRMAGS